VRRERGALEAVRNTAAGHVVGADFDLDLVAEGDADAVPAHLPREAREQLVSVFEFYAEREVREAVDDFALDFNGFFFRTHGFGGCSFARYFARNQRTH